MINYEIDCPFEIGDTVYVKTIEDEYAEIECPFCHGFGEYNTGIKINPATQYKNPTYAEKRRTSGLPQDKAEWVIGCKTCGGRGKIRQFVDYKVCYHKGTLAGVWELHSSGWRSIVYKVELDDGNEKHIEGRCILTEEQYTALAKQGGVSQ